MFAKIFSKKITTAPADEGDGSNKKLNMLSRVFTRKPAPAPTKQSVSTPSKPKIWFGTCHIEDFELGRVLGTGSFGRVQVAHHKATKQVCAIKQLSKASIVKTKQVGHVMAEKGILQKLDFPFIVNLLGCCMDDKCVYLILEYVNGGEFFTYLRHAGRLDEAATRFYAAQVLLSFEHIHSQDIIYRDLKPENLLLDDKGHIKIADFGFAKKIDRRTYTLCGTPDYLAPEIILNKGHGKPVDWWAFGVLIYEMLAGYPPFYDDDAIGTYQKILSGKVQFPPHFSRSAKDLIRKLLTADLTKRIGCLESGVNEIKNHAWFANVKWESLLLKKELPPIKPKVSGADDTSNFEDYSKLDPIHHEFVLTADDQALFKDLC